MKKIVCRWVPHNLTEHQEAGHVRMSVETLQLFNDGINRIISNFITGDEIYITFFDVQTRQESKVWVSEDDLKPTMLKRNEQ